MQKSTITDRDIQKALVNKEFLLYYQPLYELKDCRIIGVEALLRWRHPVAGMISPGSFMPVAEEGKQIYELDKAVFREALRQVRKWREEKLQLELSVNLSAKTLTSSKHFEEIEGILVFSGEDTRMLTIEITETALLADMELAADRIKGLRNSGIKVALDDFGTGYSSILHLKKMEVDIIKIDRSFVEALPQSGKDGKIIKNMVAMAHNLEYRVIAEGIETEAQLEFLKGLSCEYGQGYYLCKPVPAEKITSSRNDISFADKQSDELPPKLRNIY